MRYLLTLILLTISFDISFAQNSTGKAKISGTVINASTKEPIDFATITIFRPGTKNIVNGIGSDAKGNFTVSGLQTGSYKVAIDFIGYKEKIFESVTITASSTSVQLGTILLVSTVDQLQSVTVTAKTPIIENKVDKTVFNTANDLTAQNGVALDVLKKVPMVSVDIDGNVELQGSGSVRFLINGKPSSIFGVSKNRLVMTYNYFSSTQYTDYIASEGIYGNTAFPTTGIPGNRPGKPEGVLYNHNANLPYSSQQIIG